MTLNTRKIRGLLDDLLAEAREAMAAVEKSRPGTERWHKNYNRYTRKIGQYRTLADLVQQEDGESD